ncbi:E3 ubiquitin-protein ligase sh3rf3 [Thoreauomyces humboldtii]|nr:E3 ubiquitin-protein ligase sh3rf3 [Thoreauomyces humboldtii]
MVSSAASRIAIALGVLSTLSVVRADSQGVPSECIPIDSTSSCAPFGKGHYINSTELGLVYGLTGPVPNAAYWDNLIRDVTSGGEHQAAMWKNWAQCSGYNGEPIQYYRSYTCMTDIYMFSSGCNQKAPPVPICKKACNDYGGAVASLIKDSSVCPSKIASISAAAQQEVNERRASALTGAASCLKIATQWEGQDGYKSDPNSCTWGVDDDNFSCGFGGDDKTAGIYCQDFPNDACCKRRGAHPATGNAAMSTDDKARLSAIYSAATSSTPKESVAAAGLPSEGTTELATAAGTTVAAPDSTGSSSNKTAIIWGAIGAGILVLAVGIFLVVQRLRSKSRSRVDPRKKNDKGAGAVPFLAPSMKEVNGGASDGQGAPLTAKHTVVYDYAPQLIDELELRKGDLVEVWASYDDGWGKGTNVRTGNKGTFPMPCVELIRE